MRTIRWLYMWGAYTFRSYFRSYLFFDTRSIPDSALIGKIIALRIHCHSKQAESQLFKLVKNKFDCWQAFVVDASKAQTIIDPDIFISINLEFGWKYHVDQEYTFHAFHVHVKRLDEGWVEITNFVREEATVYYSVQEHVLEELVGVIPQFVTNRSACKNHKVIDLPHVDRHAA